jgi:hypothetical protein
MQKTKYQKRVLSLSRGVRQLVAPLFVLDHGKGIIRLLRGERPKHVYRE